LPGRLKPSLFPASVTEHIKPVFVPPEDSTTDTVYESMHRQKPKLYSGLFGDGFKPANVVRIEEPEEPADDGPSGSFVGGSAHFVWVPVTYFARRANVHSSACEIEDPNAGVKHVSGAYLKVDPDDVQNRNLANLFHNNDVADVVVSECRENVLLSDYFLMDDYFCLAQNPSTCNPLSAIFGNEKELKMFWRNRHKCEKGLRTRLGDRTLIGRVQGFHLIYDIGQDIFSELWSLLSTNYVFLAFALGASIPAAIYCAFLLYRFFVLLPQVQKFIPRTVIDPQGKRHLVFVPYEGTANHYREWSGVIVEAKGKNKSGRAARKRLVRIKDPARVVKGRKFKFIYDLDTSSWIQVDQDFDISGVANLIDADRYLRYIVDHADAFQLSNDMYDAALSGDINAFLSVSVNDGYYDDVEIEDDFDYDQSEDEDDFYRDMTPDEDEGGDVSVMDGFSEAVAIKPTAPAPKRPSPTVTFTNAKVSQPEATIRAPSFSISFSKGIHALKNDVGSALISASGPNIFYSTHVREIVHATWPQVKAFERVLGPKHSFNDEQIYIAPKPNISGFASAGGLAVAKEGDVVLTRAQSFPTIVSSGRVYLLRDRLVHDAATDVGDCNTCLIQDGHVVGWHFATTGKTNEFLPVTPSLLAEIENYRKTVFPKSPADGAGVKESKKNSPARSEVSSSAPPPQVSVYMDTNGIPCVKLRDQRTGRDRVNMWLPSLEVKHIDHMTDQQWDILLTLLRKGRVPSDTVQRLKKHKAVQDALASSH
jgi:hypothetical protein